MPVIINGTTGISGVDGSAGTPAFQGSDTNTGIRFGTDIVSLVTGGSDRLYIDTSGRLLVGTSSAGSSTTAAFQGHDGVSTNAGVVRIVKGVTTPANGDALGYVAFGDSTQATSSSIQGDRDGGTWSASSKPGRLVFSTTADGASSPTEQLRITSDRYVRLASGTGGIQFGGDTAAVNALDDYEEGNWTPTLLGGASSPTSVAYSTQNGSYTKIGRQVTCRFYLSFSTFVGGSGQFVIGGLPFVSDATANTFSEYNIPYATNITYPAGATTIGLEIPPANTTMVLYGMGSAFGGYQVLTFGTSLVSSVSQKLFLAVVTYFVA